MENMKYIILRKVKIIDSESKYHLKKNDILIKEGIIEKIEKTINITEPFFEIDIKGLHISPGWLDLHVRLGEPGLEERETIKNGLKSAARGGFTAVLYMPSTKPVIQTKTDILFLLKKNQNNIVDLLPSGSITKNSMGQEITEMFDMHLNGAVAFTDDKNSIQNAMVMNIALEYVKNFDGLIMINASNEDLEKNGQVNEGIMSTKMGLKPLPELAENIMVMRDLEILRYTNSKLHISTISTQKSVQNIKKAKKEKLKISTDIAAHNLILNDEEINTFNSNFKVKPPLRDEKTRLFLIENILNGTIDAVSSDHSPIQIEKKKCEFEQAEFGIIGLETTFPIINTVLKGKMELSKIIDLISRNPRKILKQKTPQIQEGEKANMTLFDPNKTWRYQKEEIISKSKNTPFIGYQFTGQIIGIINNGQIEINT